MDVHPVHGGIHSVKDFFLHLLTITVGILIALTLEGLVTWHEHRKLVEEARSNLAVEIARNRETMSKALGVMQGNQNDMKQIVGVMDELTATRKLSVHDLRAHWEVPELYSTSWSTAQNSGAVAYMTYQEVEQYTEIYDLQQKFVALEDRVVASVSETATLVATTMNKDLPRVPAAEFHEIERSASRALAGEYLLDAVGKGLAATYAKYGPQQQVTAQTIR